MNRDARLRAVDRLTEHARHHPHCAGHGAMNADEHCDCGLADLVRAVKFALLGHVVGGIRDIGGGTYSCLCGERTTTGAPPGELDAFAARHEALGIPDERSVDDAVRRALAESSAGDS